METHHGGFPSRIAKNPHNFSIDDIALGKLTNYPIEEIIQTSGIYQPLLQRVQKR